MGAGPRAAPTPTDRRTLIAACALAKLRIVARDERDGGAAAGAQPRPHGRPRDRDGRPATRRYRHGEAVALGLLAALRLSGQRELRDEVRDLLGAHGLPTRLDDADPDAVVMATARDKKRVGEGPVPFVLLDAPGVAAHRLRGPAARS